MAVRAVPAWALEALRSGLPAHAPILNVRAHSRTTIVANTPAGAAVVTKPRFGAASLRLLPNPRGGRQVHCPDCGAQTEFRSLSLPAEVHCPRCGRRIAVGGPADGAPPPPPPAPGRSQARAARAALEKAQRQAESPAALHAALHQAVAESPELAPGDAGDATRFRRLKATLVNAAAHELQTPMTPLLLSLHVLEAEAEGAAGAGAARHRQAIQTVVRNARRVEDVIARLVKVAQVQAHGVPLAPAPMDLAATVRTAAQAWRERAHAGGIRLGVRVPHSLPCQGDAARLGELVDHLLSNAVRFTSAGGRIHVTLAHAGTGAHLHVTDTGAGIAADDLERVFEPFVQIDDARTQAGLGLGLFFARAIAESHGGALRAASPGPGRGAHFTATVPAPPPTLAARIRHRLPRRPTP